MFTLVFSLLKTHWQTALIASLLISALGTFSFERYEIRHLGNQLTRCHDENRALETSNKALMKSIEDQNAAITALAAQARRKKNAAEKRMSQAQLNAASHRFSAEKILQTETSRDDCATLRKLVNDFVKAP